MTSLLQDLRYSLRVIRKHPVASAVIVATLALGIAANTAMWAGFDAWIVRPLPLEDPDTLVTLAETQPRLGAGRHPISPANLRDWQEQSRTLSEIAAYDRRMFNFYHRYEPQRVAGASVSAGLFPLLGVAPARGRHFLESEDRPGGPLVAILSHHAWQIRFDGDPEIVGKTVRLDDRLHEIVAVMPPGFKFPEWAELWTPLALDPDELPRGERFLEAIGRLAPGATLETARAELGAIAERLAKLYPESNSGWGVSVLPVREEWVPPVIRVALLSSLGAAFFVLLIICANVANLMLAQATGRQRETALRAALGASRRRLVRQALTESTLLALAAGALGTALGGWGVRWMKSWAPIEPPYMFEFAVDGRALAYTLLVSLAAGLVCGLAPVVRSSGLDLAETLKSGGRSGEGVRGSRMRDALVVLELAFCVLLVVGALLMVKSFLEEQRIDTGYRTRGVLTLRLSLTGEAYDDPRQRVAFLDRALDRLASLTGVETVGATSHLPASRSGWETVRLEAEGRPARPGEEPRTTRYAVSREYLETLDVSVTAGRPFTASEVLDGGEVAIVSESLAAHLWPGEDPLGRRLRTVGEEETGPWRTVVGIAGHVDPGHSMVDSGGRPRSQLYVPYGAEPAAMVTLALRSDADVASLAPAVRSELRRVDPGVPVSEVLPIERAIEKVQWVSRYFGRLFTLYAAIALLIAALGVYGITADSVSRRRREMGIRIALGARPGDLLRQVLVRHGLRLGVLGVAIGLVAALPLARFLSSMLYRVSASDPAVFAGVGLLLAAMAGLASYLPARQAARVDPIETLRFE